MKRRGFSLVEMLVVMALLAVLGTILTLILRQTLQIERMQTESFDSALQRNALADQFRADVAQAENAPAVWEPDRADARTLILRMKTGERLIYRWRDGQLQRLSYPDGGVKAERTLPLGKQVAVEFVRDDAKVVRLRLIGLRDGKVVPGQTVEIAAALGGDWR